ncbi:glycoside hydrolase family 18 protein [Suillus subalutaceus]|uniref:glycoside hydrolase family 18 protein n=1 Tax=Suillus subalutaceus TaxID=48586 RepID=UPI001B85D7A7|nr:glycoside hydrolase family 18 protein [Suillus subalutaceus]KAG1860708.1 glycoside hydrolase family 18 protein [Suillus subalutaceus]
MVFVLSSILSVLAFISGLLPMPPVEMAFSAHSTPAAPYFVIYSDKWISGETGPPAVSEVTGYNVFALSFWLISGPADQAEEWTLIDNATRASYLTSYHDAGISLIVSAFGSTDAPTTEGYDPTTIANDLAAFVLEYDLDGVDIDYEDFNAMNAENGSAETWLTTFTEALRAQLPQGQYILTHAPVAPWFSTSYTSGAYLTVNKNVGSLIDWASEKITGIFCELIRHLTFYNQGTTEYTTCTGLLTESSTTWPDTSLFQIAAAGVSLDKLVIGKPATTADATNGYMNTTLLAQCVDTAYQQGWDAGVMVWEFPDAAAAWIEAVRALAFPE